MSGCQRRAVLSSDASAGLWMVGPTLLLAVAPGHRDALSRVRRSVRSVGAGDGVPLFSQPVSLMRDRLPEVFGVIAPAARARKAARRAAAGSRGARQPHRCRRVVRPSGKSSVGCGRDGRSYSEGRQRRTQMRALADGRLKQRPTTQRCCGHSVVGVRDPPEARCGGCSEWSTQNAAMSVDLPHANERRRR